MQNSQSCRILKTVCGPFWDRRPFLVSSYLSVHLWSASVVFYHISSFNFIGSLFCFDLADLRKCCSPPSPGWHRVKYSDSGALRGQLSHDSFTFYDRRICISRSHSHSEDSTLEFGSVVSRVRLLSRRHVSKHCKLAVACYSLPQVTLPQCRGILSVHRLCLESFLKGAFKFADFQTKPEELSCGDNFSTITLREGGVICSAVYWWSPGVGKKGDAGAGFLSACRSPIILLVHLQRTSPQSSPLTVRRLSIWRQQNSNLIAWVNILV